MKKYVIGFIIGALLMFSGQALANTVSRVGLKVGSEATVILNGNQLPDAIIVDSKSYAPVKDIADAFGADVKYEPASKGKKAVITLIGDIKQHPADLQALILQKEKEELEEELASKQASVENANKTINENQEKLKNVTKEWEKPMYTSEIETYSKFKEESEARIKEINERLTEINKELEALKE
jgi:peptidoglycan hydrolase CwlO-like protein